MKLIRKSFFSKIWLLGFLCSVFSVSLAIFGLVNYNIAKEKQGLVSHNMLLTQIISSEIESGYLKGLWPYKTLKMVADSPDVLFLWIAKPNKEIFWADDVETMGGFVNDPFLGTEEMVSYDAVFDGEQIKIVAHPLKIELNEDSWTIFLGISFNRFEEFQQRLLLVGIFFFVFIAIFIGLVAFYFSKKIIYPLNFLAQEMRKFGRGDPTSCDIGKCACLKTNDEIENLANTFGAMISNLQKSHTALQESRNVLEVRVRARTKELQELNKGLEKKVQQRTKELQKRLDELERFYNLTVGRELKMVELKKALSEKDIKRKQRRTKRKIS